MNAFVATLGPEDFAAAERDMQEALEQIHDICEAYRPGTNGFCSRCRYAHSDHIPGRRQTPADFQ